MTPQHGAEAKLKGTVEVDETFVGPKAKPKTAVVALVERQGSARVKVIASVTQKNLGAALGECVSREAVVNTDEHPSYKHPLKHWKAHQTVNHSRGRISAPKPGWIAGFDQHRRILLFPAQTRHHWRLASYLPGAFAQICQRVCVSLEHAA